MYSLSDTVGHTPLLRLTDTIYGKFETLNPSGSIKDRMAHYVLDEAEQAGEIKPGDTLIEATSGNTGIAYSTAAASRGYKMKVVMPRGLSKERTQIMELLGAEIIYVKEWDFHGAIELRNQLAERHGWFCCNQFHNPLNVNSHRIHIAEEILSQIPKGQKISAFVCGYGTGGTITGCGSRLKEAFPDMDIVVMEPEEASIITNGRNDPHGIEGVGDGDTFLLDPDFADHVYCIPTAGAIMRTRQLIREKGLLVGFSSGAHVMAAEQYVREHNPDGLVVTVLCDRVERYLSVLEKGKAPVSASSTMQAVSSIERPDAHGF